MVSNSVENEEKQDERYGYRKEQWLVCEQGEILRVLRVTVFKHLYCARGINLYAGTM
jgi:hypothetical protein